MQALVFGAAAQWLSRAWGPAAALAGICAALQVGVAAAQLTGRVAPWQRRLALATLAGVAAIYGLFSHAAWEIAVRFGTEARAVATDTLGVALAVLPWLIVLPLWQALSGRGGGGGAVGAALIGAGLSWGAHDLATRPVQTWPAQPELVDATAAARARWLGGDDALPTGTGPAVVLLTPWTNGAPGDSIRGAGADLGAAVTDALSRLPPPSQPDAALVLDVAQARWDRPTVLPPGAGGWLGAERGGSPTSLWRPERVRRREVLPNTLLPGVELKGAPTVFASAVADASGARALRHGWSEAPALAGDAARQAALAGARMLARHQDAQGRFAYVIAGPSGDEQGGYNFPRHAGVTWFLARVWARTGDLEIKAALDRGLDYLVSTTTTLPDGRAYIRDPGRNDAKVWVGTTALALLGAVVAQHPVAPSWGRFVADSVDERGQVRGEMTVATGRFEAQAQNPYGQGQSMLALASLVRAGQGEFTDALTRAATYVDGDYATLGAGRLVVLDEHWSCLAALATQDAIGRPAGWSICQAYVHRSASDTPGRGSPVHLASGAAGGLAEAVVAAAVLDPAGPWRARALDFAAMFLDSAYREGDAPFLGKPLALLGGFRDTAGDWDVRMDAVQHIGCALLGAEALLDGAASGTLP